MKRLLIIIFKALRVLGGILGFSLIIIVILMLFFNIDYFHFLDKILFYPNPSSSSVTKFPPGILIFFILLISFVKGDSIINYLKLREYRKRDKKEKYSLGKDEEGKDVYVEL